jgi:hypothetical protein
MLKIDIMVFLLSLFVGLFFVYVTAPKPNIIFKYPSLNSANKIKYIDENNTCYKYVPKQTNCSN